MPIMPNGNFRIEEEIRSDIKSYRSLAETIRRMSEIRGVDVDGGHRIAAMWDRKADYLEVILRDTEAAE